MIKKYLKILPLSLIVIFLSGCWNYRDINNTSIDLSIGIDEEDGLLEYTGEIAKLDASGGKAYISDEYKYRALGKYFEGSRIAYDSTITRPDFSGAVRTVVFSKNYAHSKGIESYINRLYYVKGFRNSALVVVSKEPTKELYSGIIKNNTSIGYAIENTISTLSDKGDVIYKSVQEVKSDISFKDIGYVLPYINKNRDTIEYLGLAAMNEDRLIDTINRDKSKGFLFILAKKTNEDILVPYNDNIISTKNILKKRKIKTTYEENKINIYIDLALNSQIIYLYDNKPVNPKDTKKFEEYISGKISEQVNYALDMSQKKLKCDVFGFARYFMADNYKIYKNINWKDEYLKAKFHVNVKTIITNTNLLDITNKR